MPLPQVEVHLTTFPFNGPYLQFSLASGYQYGSSGSVSGTSSWSIFGGEDHGDAYLEFLIPVDNFDQNRDFISYETTIALWNPEDSTGGTGGTGGAAGTNDTTTPSTGGGGESAASTNASSATFVAFLAVCVNALIASF